MCLLSSLICLRTLAAISHLVLPSFFLLSAPWVLLLRLLLFLLVLRSFSLSVSLPAAPLSVSAPPPLLPPFSSAFPLPPVSTPLPSAKALGFSTPSVCPPPGFSAPAPSGFPSFAPAVPLPDPSPAPSAPPGFSLRPSAPAFPAFPGVAAPAVPVAAPVAPAALAPLFHPLSVSGSSHPPVSSSASFTAPAAASTAVPGFASGVPPVPQQSPVSSAAPSASAFVGSAEDHFDPGYPDVVLRDPEVPIPPSLPDSFRAELRHMYAYLMDLFPQAAGAPAVDPPLRAVFEEFFTQAWLLSSQFTLVGLRTVLAETDPRLTAFLASGRLDYLFLPSRSSHYAVRVECAQG